MKCDGLLDRSPSKYVTWNLRSHNRVCNWGYSLIMLFNRKQLFLNIHICSVIVIRVGFKMKNTSMNRDDVIKWKHFPHYWPFVWGLPRSPVNSPHKGQWGGALMFSLICAWIDGWVNHREGGDLRRHRAHYDVTVMMKSPPIAKAVSFSNIMVVP